MRWMWIDAFIEFVPGERCTAVKNVTMAEGHVHDRFPAYPVLPPGLMIEGMAQTAGILVGESRKFSENVILAKVRNAEFDDYAFPGDQLRYEARIDSIDDHGAMTSGLVFKNGEHIGRVDLMFSHVNRAAKQLDLPDHNFVFTDNFLKLVADMRHRFSTQEPSGE
jgi:3-hydroxyacyl-[acyl-carrier-protein] dehydratase